MNKFSLIVYLFILTACASTTDKNAETNTKKSMTKYTFIDYTQTT